MNEAQTREKLIDPVLYSLGWTEENIKTEVTAGAIEIINGKPKKINQGRVDYTLRLCVAESAQPVAIALLEAKAEHLPPNHGLEQAKRYGKLLNVPFVYTSNGHQFVEYDRHTGLTTHPQPLTEFPTPQTLRNRYEKHQGFNLEEEIPRPLITQYRGGETTRRYYQDAAIRAVFEKIARCEKQHQPKRALLSLATGAGKTFIATQLLCRLADAGQLRRALFVCDRDELRTQGAAALKQIFGSDVAMVSAQDPKKNARILVATYQTLDVDNPETTTNFLTTHYPQDYFSHIIIDECHRSAWGKWSQVLSLNSNAVQIGLTATPRRLEVIENTPEVKEDLQISADNLLYFGEAVYEYEIAQGIEDGYLAACEIKKGRVNLDDTGITFADIIARTPRDAKTGEVFASYRLSELKEIYDKTSYENRILLPDRVAAMCQDLFSQLLETGTPEQKTVIFCVRDSHADDVAAEMNNLYVKWCLSQGKKPLENYAFKCTAKSSGGDYLPDLKGSSRSHFIATTVDLLTTGVDVPRLENIVFFRYMRSPITFYQMIGRGTRLNPATGKLMFRVYDYTNATRLFGQEFISKISPKQTKLKGGGELLPGEKEEIPTIIVEGFEVGITPAGHYILTMVDGKAMPVTLEEYKERLAEKLIETVPSIADFRDIWVSGEQRRLFLSELPDGGRSPLLIRQLLELDDCDLYDILAELGYGLIRRTRIERTEAFNLTHQDWLKAMPETTAATIKAITIQFARNGTDELENPKLFRTPEVSKAGGLEALKQIGKPFDVLYETKVRLFAA